ncbi:hypothetical protein LUZ60_016066 [Juncus effusus]|nr:hypothetical protein LUZ60_016066 [Juncus effusus]
MGTGWRRALCTSVRRDTVRASDERRSVSPSPRSCSKLSFFSSSTNPNTPRALRCRTKPSTGTAASYEAEETPVKCRTPSPPSPTRSVFVNNNSDEKEDKLAVRLGKKGLRLLSQSQAQSAPCSPRSPSKFSLFNHLKPSLLSNSKGKCGVCSQSVKSGLNGSMAVFTAECGHAFHLPCIMTYMRAHPSLSCPVCSATWHHSPFLSSLRFQTPNDATTSKPKPHFFDDNAENRNPKKDRSGDNPTSKPPAPNYKVYNDDEPLPQSKAATHAEFNPIPEANEEKDEDDIESESGDELHRNGDGNTNAGLTVSVSPEAALVSTGRKHGKYVVSIKVKAPSVAKSSHAKRAPVDLVTVLDVGQGMTAEKLQMLKRAMRLVIASLGMSDRLSIVAFSCAAAKRLLPLRRMSRQGQRSARHIVDRLVVAAGSAAVGAAGNACMGDALKKATKVLEERRERNPVATIMLLSDTQQTRFTQHAPPNATTRFAHVEIPLRDEPPPPTLESTPNKEEDAFVRCLGGLVSVVMQDVRLQLTFPGGGREILAVYSCGGAGQKVMMMPSIDRSGVVSLRVGDLYAGEERQLLVEVRAPLRPQHHHVDAMVASWTCRDPTSRESVSSPEKPFLLPPLHYNTKSAHLHDLFVATRALAESRQLLELNDYGTALHLLSSTRSLLLQGQCHPSSLIDRLDSQISQARLQRDQQHQRQQEEFLSPSVSQMRRRIINTNRDDSLTPMSASSSMRQRMANTSGEESLTPTSAWRAAEQLAKVAIMRKSMNRVGDLHGFENARF